PHAHECRRSLRDHHVPFTPNVAPLRTKPTAGANRRGACAVSPRGAGSSKKKPPANKGALVPAATLAAVAHFFALARWSTPSCVQALGSWGRQWSSDCCFESYARHVRKPDVASPANATPPST